MSPPAAFREALRRHLRRRTLAVALQGARAGGSRAFLLAAGLILLLALGVLPLPGGPVPCLLLYTAILAVGMVVGGLHAVGQVGGEAGTAAELDRVLAGKELVATAVVLASRPEGDQGRFRSAVLERAAEEVAGLPSERVGTLPRRPWRWLFGVALVAFLLPLLPQGGFGILPGLGSGWGTGSRPRAAGANAGAPKEVAGGRPTPGQEPGKREPDAPPKPGETMIEPKEQEKPPAVPPAEPPKPVASLSLVPLARTYQPSGPVSVGVLADGKPGAGMGTDLDLAISVDDKPPVAEHRPFRLADGEHPARTIDLRALPGLPALLGPGKHRVKGTLVNQAGDTVAESPEVRVIVEGGEDSDRKGGGGSPPPAPPPPTPAPQAAQPPPPESGVKPPASPKRPGKAQDPPDLPPSNLNRQLVRPLFGEGAEVEKKGPLLILDPEGSRGEEPRELPPEEALREVKARAEAAARREGVDPRDLESVRLYFEALRRILEEKK